MTYAYKTSILEAVMTDSQPLTLSLRISESLRKRLEHFRELSSRTKGEKVSTSEVAKQLLETSGDRLQHEIVGLRDNTTESLLRIRKKCEAQQPLLRAEWALLADFAQQGAESFHNTPISDDSYRAVIEAFLATFQLRRGAPPEGRDD